MATPPLGWIEPIKRNLAQQSADSAAKAGLTARFALPIPALAKGQRIALFDAWKHPDVVADVGFVFTRFHQFTGSCVKCGGTNALFSTIAMQRLASDAPTKAFMPFAWHNYAMSRHYFGDDGQGEGSLGSTFFKSLGVDGVRDWPVPAPAGMPNYKQGDGIEITSKEEMAWSSIRNPNIKAVLEVSKPNIISASGECKTVGDIRAMVSNGYGVSFACNNYIGNGKIKGTGENARVMGKWDGRGGHQQSIHAVEEHPDFGPIYLALNNWPSSTYPILPNQPVCSVWVLEKDVEAAMRLDGEVYGLSHLNWFPAQPKVAELSWLL
jgi:hypothetical protein